MSNEFNFGSLLDKNIDDIEDLAGFAVPPNGMYSMLFTTATKIINDKPYVEASFEVVAVVELNDPSQESDPATKAGTKFSTLFQIENEIALSKLKELVAPVAEHFGERNLQTLVTSTINNLVVVGKVKRREVKGKDGKEDKTYADVSSISIS